MPRPTEDLGEVLLQFLHYFGNIFNPITTGVQIQGANSFFLISHAENSITIDPINSENNTTKGSFKVTEVLRHFSLLNARLKDLLSKSRTKGVLKVAFSL